MAEKPSWTAMAALVVSVSTAAFSWYQWRTEGAEERIRYTVEVSKEYVQEATTTQLDSLIPRIPSQPSVQPLSTDEAEKLYRYLGRMEYIAFLANHGLMDVGFMPSALKCDIYRIGTAVEKMAGLDSYLREVGGGVDEAIRFGAKV